MDNLEELLRKERGFKERVVLSDVKYVPNVGLARKIGKIVKKAIQEAGLGYSKKDEGYNS